MATAGEIERAIHATERFRVRMVDANGRDVRSDRSLGRVSWGYSKAANGNMTVAEWRRTRFGDLRCAEDVHVLLGDGSIAHGNYLLSTIRASY